VYSGSGMKTEIGESTYQRHQCLNLQQCLTLKTALADISAATNTHKQNAVTFEVFVLVLWLHNQCYYTCDVIGIKMTYRDLPYYEGIRPKHTMNINFTKTSTKITQAVYIPLENGP